MKRFGLLIAAGLSLFAATTGIPPRSDLAASELMVDKAIQSKWAEDPFILIGGTRAFYINGFGVVMTTELNLVTGPSVNPFNPTLSEATKINYRKRKLERLPQLRDLMSTTLEQVKGRFPTLKDDEQVVLGVQLYRYSWEDPAGLPTQIVYQSAKRNGAPVKSQDY
ncbi:MAG TPA: hypothetical protein VGL53_13150 [Bryobacteraceae bacterium]|jgi:hypothetical protein